MDHRGRWITPAWALMLHGRPLSCCDGQWRWDLLDGGGGGSLVQHHGSPCALDLETPWT